MDSTSKNDKTETEEVSSIPILTEAEFNADIEEMVKNSLVENLQLSIKKFSSQFESAKFLNIKSINEKWIIDIDFIFSSTYNHPVVYFFVYDHEGNYSSLEEVFSYMFEGKYDPKLDIFAQKLTQKAHPFLGNMMSFIHPCDMGKYYEQVYKHADTKRTSKTFFWLSLYFQVMKISPDIRFYQQNQTKANEKTER